MGTQGKVGQQVWQQIYGSKPTKTLQISRSVQNANLGYFFGIFEIGQEKICGWLERESVAT